MRLVCANDDIRNSNIKDVIAIPYPALRGLSTAGGSIHISYDRKLFKFFSNLCGFNLSLSIHCARMRLIGCMATQEMI